MSNNCVRAKLLGNAYPRSPYVIYTVPKFISCNSRTNVCQCMVVQTSRNNKKSQVLCCPAELANQIYVQLGDHPCPGNWSAIGHAVVYYARDAHAFSAGNNCRHCTASILEVYYGVGLMMDSHAAMCEWGPPGEISPITLARETTRSHLLRHLVSSGRIK